MPKRSLALFVFLLTVFASIAQTNSLPPLPYYEQTQVLKKALELQSGIDEDTAAIRNYRPPFTSEQISEKVMEWAFLNSEVEIAGEGRYSMNQIHELGSRILAFSESIQPWWDDMESRKKTLSEIQSRLEEQIRIWNRTLDSLPDDCSKNVVEKATSVSGKLDQLRTELIDSLNQTLDRQTGIAEDYMTVQTKLKELELLNRNYYNQLKEVYYPFSAQKDTLQEALLNSANIQSPFKRTLTYLQGKKEAVYWHIAITLFFILLFFFIQYEVRHKKPEGTNTTSVQVIVTYPIAAAFSLGILMFLVLYPNRPQVFGEVFSFFAVVIMTGFFTRFFERKIFIPWLFLFLAYILNFGRIHFIDNELLDWWSGLITLGLILVQVWMLNRDKEFITKRYGRFGKRLELINPVIGTLTVIIFMLQLFGFYYLANYSVNVLVRTLVFAMILYIITLVFKGMVIFALNSRFFEWSRVIEAGNRNIQVKTSAWTNFAALLIWIWGFFRITGLTSSFRTETLEFINRNWEVGTATISLAQIFAFITVVFVTIILSTALKSILEIEILSRFNLKRGVPSAVAQMTRYFVLLIGFYLAIGAMGVNLNKLGFIAGALGVGIGFGLQNIVANFISGLILFLERPINKGDVVNVNVPGSVTGRTMGEVLEIGIRSSKVKTYDGAEVIVPNSEFVSREVVNYTLSDERRRVERIIPLEIGTDPNKVAEIIMEVYDAHEKVLKDPKAMVLFNGNEQGAMNFRLLFWIRDGILEVPSEILLEIHRRFAEAGIKIQKPAMDVELRKIKK